jgi:MoaA/NifB/PqqE/SkfB family radical SAM enzyme
MIKKTVLFTTYQCNNQCIFCINAERRNIPGKTTEEIKKEMVEARGRGSTYLELIGGEFDILPDALPLMRFAKGLGFKTIMMATNGRMFSYPDFTKKMIDAGLTDIVFSIHGHTPELHDELTQSPGSFEQLLKGLENFKKLKFKNIGSNTTIVRQNCEVLPEIGSFIFDLGIKNAEFIFVDPNHGGAKINFEKLVPKISESAPYIQKTLDIGKKTSNHWHVRYVPLCYFKDYLAQISEIYEIKQFETEHIAPDFKNFSVEKSRALVGREKTKRCKKCKLYAQCEGIWKNYLNHYGDSELKPIID